MKRCSGLRRQGRVIKDPSESALDASKSPLSCLQLQPVIMPDQASNVLAPLNRLFTIQGHLALEKMGGNNPTVFQKDNVPQAPEDPLFGLMAAYRKDDFEKKVDLGIGAYRDDNAKPWVLPVVKQADEVLRKDPNLNHEYLPIAGLADFTSAAQKLILGEGSPAIKDKRVRSESNL